ncbi:heme-dependent oxidative N-demethylase family protein [Billgrantia endophytica]|uniref:DUF3445 domain-containing protein n=1 Tax=Billgrantia endophytica TaxID=2033802 RepID=A0A2N7TZQ0_9GAMM|nr:DUF3445 domain-containing protein [Halomonas endophytica]PMR73664.1 hypothetical protein C1H69_16570 [Halomonas endophytica]
MHLAPRDTQAFRGNFTYRNSRKAIERFPFPFPEDDYRYSVNIEPHRLPGPKGSVYEHMLDIDEHYLSETAERDMVLMQDPGRCLAMPHMEPACWDLVEFVMSCYAKDYPEHFSFERQGDECLWENRPLKIQQRFRFGDPASLPLPPMEYIGRQMQGDFALLDQRHGDLFMDAGVITSPADWSLAFDAGMSFKQWHGPVPLAHEMGVFERALKYLCAIQAGGPVRRLNWTMTIHPRMDSSPETYHEWGRDRTTITPDNVGKDVFLRVELQTLVRMPRSHALFFGIRTYLISLDDLVTNQVWARRLHRVLKGLPQALVDYKGLSRYRGTLVEWLSQYDDDVEPREYSSIGSTT